MTNYTRGFSPVPFPLIHGNMAHGCAHNGGNNHVSPPLAADDENAVAPFPDLLHVQRARAAEFHLLVPHTGPPLLESHFECIQPLPQPEGDPRGAADTWTRGTR